MNGCANVESEWIAVYLFSNVDFESVITELLGKLVNDQAIANKMRTFYFIRYWEGGPHIRFRVLPLDGSYKEEIIRVIYDKSHLYFSKKKITNYRIEFPEYRRETDRYIGLERTKISEYFFENSSRAVLKIIQNYSMQWSKQLGLGIAIRMHAIFADAMLSTNREKIELFYNNLNNWMLYAITPDCEGNISFDTSGETMHLFQSSFERQNGRFRRIYDNGSRDEKREDWEEIWALGCLSFRAQLDALKPWTKEEMIRFYDAHIHMTNNRLGVHLRDEAFIAYVLKRLYEDIDVTVSHPSKSSIA